MKLNNYSAPEGYIYDENTGLYYTQIIAEDEQGNQSQIVNWFDPETGEYTQQVYPININRIEGEKRSLLKWIVIGIIGFILLSLIVIGVYFVSNSNKKDEKKEQAVTNEMEISEREEEALETDITEDKVINDEENSDTDEYVTDDIYGVYKNDEMVVVVAPGVEHYQAAADGVHDIGTSEDPDFWIVRYEPESQYIYFGTNVSIENEVIIDYTENESGHVVDMAYGCMGKEMTYYELVAENGQQRDILLKKTTEDPVKAYYYYVDMYNEMVK